jgi:hypothetical protein
MQTANGLLLKCPESHQMLRNITPGEALILHKLHFQYANGNPLGDFVIQPEAAVTIDIPAQAAREEEHNLLTGKVTPGKPAVPAKTHPRTNSEEVERLKRKYTGLIEGKTAFEGTFGSALGVRLPETFEEIVPVVGAHFSDKAEDPVSSDEKVRTTQLAAMKRPDLVQIALGLGLTIHAADSAAFIVAAIVNEENKQATPTSVEEEGKLEEAPVEDLRRIASELGISVKPWNPAKIISAIREKRSESAPAVAQ